MKLLHTFYRYCARPAPPFQARGKMLTKFRENRRDAVLGRVAVDPLLYRPEFGQYFLRSEGLGWGGTFFGYFLFA